MSIDDLLENKTFVSVSTLKIKTGIDGRRLANILRKKGFERYTKGKTRRPIWVRKECEEA